jgi:hypothetical protein
VQSHAYIVQKPKFLCDQPEQQTDKEWPFGAFLVLVFKTHTQTHAFTTMLDV